MKTALQPVLLCVKQTPEVLQTGDGGIQYLTSSDLGGGGSGGLPSFQDILYTDDTGAQFIYKDTGTTTPVITAYLVPAGTVYTVGANPRPYTVNDLRTTSVDIGVKADTAASSDTGTFSLIALFKRSLQKLTLLISTQTLSLVTTQTLAIGATSVASSSVNILTTRITLTATVDCWVSIGTIPTAIANSGGGIFFLSAGIPSYPILVPASSKIAVILDSVPGYLNIIESA